MRKISLEELINLSDQYTGKQVEFSLSPIFSTNTYRHFRLRNEDNVLIFYDINSKLPQELIVDKSSIEEINYIEGDIFESTFSIFLKDNGRIDFCVTENPIICIICKKIIDTPYEPMWKINQVGEFGSEWENERKVFNFCDHCLLEILGYKDGDLQ